MWTAVVRDGRLAGLDNGMDRTAVVARRLALAAEEPKTVVGLDFAFSFPALVVRGPGLAQRTRRVGGGGARR
jgi:hypothetical protein